MTVSEEVPDDFDGMLEGLTDRQKSLAKKLYELGQSHLFESWKSSDEDDDAEKKRKLATQLESLDESYGDNGLVGYIQNARRLLENSRNGVNPLEGWVPSVPAGQAFELGTPEYETTEKLGMEELKNGVGFVLVAGGLGERLGYGDIKVRTRIACSSERMRMKWQSAASKAPGTWLRIRVVWVGVCVWAVQYLRSTTMYAFFLFCWRTAAVVGFARAHN